MPARAQDAVFPTAETRETLATAYAAILDRHLNTVAPRDLALWSLLGLAALDPELGAELRGGSLRLTGVGIPPPARALPNPQTRAPIVAMSLAEPVAALLDAAWRASPALRRLPPERVLQAAFDEVFNRLDPYSRYVSTAEARAARERRVGQSGLGLRLGAVGRGDAVAIVALTPGGPASLGGLRRGDRVLAVDGVPVLTTDLPAATAALEGPSDAPVALTILRGGRRREVVLLRAPVPPATVQAEWRDDILWLRMTGFSSGTDAQLAATLEDAFRTALPRGIVLDLRGNRGGMLSQAVAVADTFLGDGEIVRTIGRHRESGRIYVAGGPDLAAGLPLVVLVDGRTASAAEVVAAALGDRGRALVIGSATLGKGFVQLLVPLPNGAELLVSWSRLVAPRGWPIQDLGVMPHLCASLGAEAAARDMARLIRGEAPMATALAQQRVLRVPVSAADALRLRGACPPADARESDLALARAALDHAHHWHLALGN